MRSLQTPASAWIAFVLAIVLLNSWFPQPFGPSALGAIFEPYLMLTALAAGIACIGSAGWPVRALVPVLLAIALLRYAPAWTSPPTALGEGSVRVSTWNMLAGEDAETRVLEAISGSSAHLVGLQELEPEVAAALSSEATGFPYQAMLVDPDVSDVGLLSRYPILESEALTDLPALRVVIDPPGSDPIVVYVAHPPLARFVTYDGVPYGVDLTARDASIARIRIRVDEDLRDGRSVILMGDFNTTEREAAYAWLSAGLRDAHLDAGVGPGFTWRPSPLSFIPAGLLRIDYVLSTPDLVAISSSVDCSPRSDHCRLDAHLSIASTVPVGAASGRRPPRRVGPQPPARLQVH